MGLTRPNRLRNTALASCSQQVTLFVVTRFTLHVPVSFMSYVRDILVHTRGDQKVLSLTYLHILCLSDFVTLKFSQVLE